MGLVPLLSQGLPHAQPARLVNFKGYQANLLVVIVVRDYFLPLGHQCAPHAHQGQLQTSRPSHHALSVMQDILLHLEHLCAVRVQLGHSRRRQGRHSVPYAKLESMDPAQHLHHVLGAILSMVFHNTPLDLETLHALPA